ASGLNCADRHAWKARRPRVLRKRSAASLPDRLYAQGPVGASAGHNHADCAVTTVFSKRGEQCIPRTLEPAWARRHAKTAAGDCQRRIWTYHVNMILLWHNAVLRVNHGKHRS